MPRRPSMRCADCRQYLTAVGSYCPHCGHPLSAVRSRRAMLWTASATIFITSAMLVVMMTTSVLAIAYPYWQALQSERGGSAPHARNLKEKQYVMDWVNHLR